MPNDLLDLYGIKNVSSGELRNLHGCPRPKKAPCSLTLIQHVSNSHSPLAIEATAHGNPKAFLKTNNSNLTLELHS
jgi:hypothetical protein